MLRISCLIVSRLLKSCKTNSTEEEEEWVATWEEQEDSEILVVSEMFHLWTTCQTCSQDRRRNLYHSLFHLQFRHHSLTKVRCSGGKNNNLAILKEAISSQAKSHRILSRAQSTRNNFSKDHSTSHRILLQARSSRVSSSKNENIVWVFSLIFKSIDEHGAADLAISLVVSNEPTRRPPYGLWQCNR